MNAGERTRIVIVGGGFGGAFAAHAFAKVAKKLPIDVTLIDRNNFLLFYPLLIEAGVGAIEPRHVVVPLRKFMHRGDFRMAEVLAIDLQAQQVHYQPIGDEHPHSLHYDHLILALGSMTRRPPVPGLADNGFEMKSLSDAISLRDRGIRLLELANTIEDPVLKKEILTFVAVGGNFTGVEFAGEYQAFLSEMAVDYPNLNPKDVSMVLVEHGKRILPTVRPHLAEWALDTLVGRGVRVQTEMSVDAVGLRDCTLTDGTKIPTRTVVWTAGIAPPEILKHIPGLPINEKGYINCERDLRVAGFPNVWAVGDCATVRTAEGTVYAATAQNASRQGPLVAQNILATLRGEPTKTFDFRPLGSFAAIGRRVAAAEFLGREFRGFIGWFMYRGAYLMKMPTFATKVRLAMDWLLEFVLRSDPVQTGVHRRRAKEDASQI
jgi:NADH:ubiquinone reductase (H+-translocating)